MNPVKRWWRDLKEGRRLDETAVRTVEQLVDRGERRVDELVAKADVARAGRGAHG